MIISYGKWKLSNNVNKTYELISILRRENQRTKIIARYKNICHSLYE